MVKVSVVYSETQLKDSWKALKEGSVVTSFMSVKSVGLSVFELRMGREPPGRTPGGSNPPGRSTDVMASPSSDCNAAVFF